jgi:hypothetical protein
MGTRTMNRVEILQLLAMASVIDPRVSRRTDGEKSAMADAWNGILDSEMPLTFAIDCLKKHYQNKSEVIMPADISVPWKSEKRYRQDKESTARQIESKRGNGMPENVRAELVKRGLLPS